MEKREGMRRQTSTKTQKMEKRRERKRKASKSASKASLCSYYLSLKGMVLDHHVFGPRTILFSANQKSESKSEFPMLCLEKCNRTALWKLVQKSQQFCQDHTLKPAHKMRKVKSHDIKPVYQCISYRFC